MTGEDLEVWGDRRSEPERAAVGDEAGDGAGGEGLPERRQPAERRWRSIPVRWLVIVPLLVLLGVWINSYSSLRDERDRALDALAAARGEAGRTSQLLELQRLESEFRSFDIIPLPEVDGLSGSLGIVNVVNSEGAPRTWLLLRARGAEPAARYRLDVMPCDEDDADFPPFTTRHTSARDGSLEMAAQNLDVPTDVDDVAVVLRDPDGEPLVGILGPLVLPRRTVTGDRAANVC